MSEEKKKKSVINDIYDSYSFHGRPIAIWTNSEDEEPIIYMQLGDITLQCVACETFDISNVINAAAAIVMSEDKEEVAVAKKFLEDRNKEVEEMMAENDEDGDIKKVEDESATDVINKLHVIGGKKDKKLLN